MSSPGGLPLPLSHRQQSDAPCLSPTDNARHSSPLFCPLISIHLPVWNGVKSLRNMVDSRRWNHGGKRGKETLGDNDAHLALLVCISLLCHQGSPSTE